MKEKRELYKNCIKGDNDKWKNIEHMDYIL